MSSRYGSRAYRADSGRVVEHEAAQRQAARAGYTLAHAGRSFRLGPVTFWIAVGSFVIMAGWSLATGTYFAFHDDVLKRLIARHAEQQFAYEDRIAELRAQVDRAASRQLLDQEQFEQKLEQILRRQTTLESRATTLTAVPDPTPTGSIRRARPAPLPDPVTEQQPLKPSPINDTVIFTVPPDREARLESRVPPPSVVRLAAAVAPSKPSLAGIEGTIAAAAGLARPRRGAPDRGAQHARGELRRQGQAHARRARRPRHQSRQDAAAVAASAARSCRSSCRPTPARSSGNCSASTSPAPRPSG